MKLLLTIEICIYNITKRFFQQLLSKYFAERETNVCELEYTCLRMNYEKSELKTTFDLLSILIIEYYYLSLTKRCFSSSKKISKIYHNHLNCSAYT